MLWRRHPNHLAIIMLSAASTWLVVSLATEAARADRLLWAALVGVVAAGLTTKRYILAATDKQLVLLRASPVRNVAVSIDRRLEAGAVVQRVSGTLVTVDWSIDGAVYTATKHADKDLASLIAAT